MHTAHVQVPHVKAVPASDGTFGAIRVLIFSRSPSAIETPSAVAQLEEHETQLRIEAQQGPVLDLVAESADFRVPLKNGPRRPPRKP
jgi:hypothetical protein